LQHVRVIVEKNRKEHMKIISKFNHGILDYASSIMLLSAPNLFGFADIGGPSVWILRFAGLTMLLQALMTDYDLGLVRLIPITMHLMADYILAMFLVSSPWLFGFDARPIAGTVTAIVMGLLAFGVALMTQPRGRARNLNAAARWGQQAHRRSG
jgi:hypothetical protein